MANQNKEDANQNQHNHKAMGASASAGKGSPQTNIENMEGVDAPENVGGERPNRSNTGSMENMTGERFDLKGNEEQPERNNR